MKKMYDEPTIEVIRIDAVDVICASGDTDFPFPGGDDQNVLGL